MPGLISPHDKLREVRRSYEYYQLYLYCLRIFEYRLDAGMSLSDFELVKIVCKGDTNKFEELKRRFPAFARFLAQYNRLFILGKVLSGKNLRHAYDTSNRFTYGQ
jgi:hypothetical protein